MEEFKVQTGTMISANLKENTLEFDMDGGACFKYGKYAIVKINDPEQIKLIAAAPELLEAVQRFVELRNRKLEDGKWEGYFEEMQTAWENIEITINKALGL